MDIPFEIEICQKVDSLLPVKDIEEMVQIKLDDMEDYNENFITDMKCWWSEIMENHIDCIRATCKRPNFKGLEETMISIGKKDYLVRMFVYRLTKEEAGIETMEADSEEISVASHWILPSQEFEGLWESLTYDEDIKEKLLRYVETSMFFSDKNVNPHIINWNKVILLHGPPGTGKTSLCKALAQKAAIRLGKRFNSTELIEINSHSLFSKWFSESGKLVMKLFTEIRRLLEDSQSLVCILIDEVESLAHARKSSMSCAEPSDSIRVVNALLTQLDQIKNYKNGLVLTTSNITEAIDLAFIDRADIKQYIGNPNSQTILTIYSSCIQELIRVKIIKEVGDNFLKKKLTESGVIESSYGLSGRALRKMVLLAATFHGKFNELYRIEELIFHLRKAVQYHRENEIQKEKKKF